MAKKPVSEMLPRKVRITAKISYSVLFVDKLENDDLGSCDKNSRQILILLGMSKKETLATFIHELIHAIEFEYNIAIPHLAVHQMDLAIEAILRLNKWVKF